MNDEQTREYWRSMTHAEKLFFSVTNGNAASFAYERLQMHIWAARSQMNRISQAMRGSMSTFPQPGPDSTLAEARDYMRAVVTRAQPALAEVHLYFVSWTGCRNMLELLVGQPEFLDAKKVYDGYRKDFEHYAAGRNSFEHFHDRLPGRREADRVKEIKPDPRAGPHRVFAGLSDGKYVHSNLEWDISPASLERLETCTTGTLAVIHAKVDELFAKRGIAG